MKNAPASRYETLTDRKLDSAPKLTNEADGRNEIRDILEVPATAEAMSDLTILGRALTAAPAMVDGAALQRYVGGLRTAVGIAASGAVLPGCLASDALAATWNFLGIWGTLTFLIASGLATVAGLYSAGILKYDTVSAGGWAILEAGGPLGGLRSGKHRVLSGTSFWYLTWVERVMHNAEISKERGNFPNAAKVESVATKGMSPEIKADSVKYAESLATLGYSASLDNYCHVIEPQGSPIWVYYSMGTEITDPFKYKTQFDNSRDGNYVTQDRKLHDLGDAILSDVAASLGIKTMDELTTRRVELAKKINEDPALALPRLRKFEEENGIKVTLSLNDIQSPAKLREAATNIQVREKVLAAKQVDVKIAEQEGAADLKRAEARAKAIKVEGDARNVLLENRFRALGGSEKVGMVLGAGEAIASIADDIVPVLMGKGANSGNGGSNGGSGPAKS